LLASLQDDQRWIDRVGRGAVGAALRLLERPFPLEMGDVIVEGTSRLLDLPEFTDARRLREVLRTIEEKARLLRLLDRCIASTGVQVIIGSEATDPGMAPVALVASRYGAGQAVQGLVGVLGPRRMEYARAVALVDHFARTISAALSSEPRGVGAQ
jgi:heat-inducible transcriptional repressor